MSKDLLKQLTFVGKKSVPSALRKDMWTPLCVMNFPNRFQGLHAYARLREFRERHETEWPIDQFTVKKGPEFGKLVGTRERSFMLMDQKANSIADMAAVLKIQARPPDPALVEKMAKRVHTKTWTFPKRLPDGEKIELEIEKPHWQRAKRGQNSKIGHRVFEFEGNILGTSVWWADPNDAEYAEDWPAEVVHGQLMLGRNRPIWPPTKEVLGDPQAELRPAQAGLSDNVNSTIAERISEEIAGSQKVERTEMTVEQKIEAARQRARISASPTSHRVMAAAIRSVPEAATEPLSTETKSDEETAHATEATTNEEKPSIVSRMYTQLFKSGDAKKTQRREETSQK